MKTIIKFTFLVLLVGVLTFISCKKETSCEGCADNKNKPPIAVAGPDQVITLPTDSVLLDGRSSSDPDGMISGWLWTKISGLVSFNINRPTDSITKVRTLVIGAYLFELKVTDNGGLSAKDTMRVIVIDPGQPNRPPVANAGTDQTITLPINTVNLDGSTSTDPDNNITGYAWTKISGPASFNIANATAVQTQVTNLVQGVYQFELKVTDADSLFSTDTMQVSVNNISSPCNLTQTLIGHLSIPREAVSIATAGNKILFAGGFAGPQVPPGYGATSRVDIYDMVTNNWSIAELSVTRFDMAVISSGNKIFFAGGYCCDSSLGGVSTRVDIYDASVNTWSTTELSEAREGIAAAKAGNKIVFAGGYNNSIGGYSNRADIYDLNTNTWATATLSQPSTGGSFISLGNKIFFGVGTGIDIYDASNNSWSTAALSQPRFGASPAILGNKIYFAGGRGNDFSSFLSNVVDIYDAATNSWSTTTMFKAKYGLAAIGADNKIFWAGGVDSTDFLDYERCNDDVEIYDVNTGNRSFHKLSLPNCAPPAFIVNNQIVFFTPYSMTLNKADIYNIINQSWSTCNVVNMGSLISVNNKIYGAGGYINNTLSNNVWRLDF